MSQAATPHKAPSNSSRAASAAPRKAYPVILKSRGGKRIYVESLARKKAVEAADRIMAAGMR